MTRGAPCSFKCKQGLQGRKRQGRQIDGEKDKRGAMQFQVQVGAPGKKTSGAPSWRRKGWDGCLAVSSASSGSREENVRGAKLTEKRTRDAPCSFKKCAMQFQVQVGAPGKKTSGAPSWRRKGREGCLAVSSASRGSREENVRGAKLTEKRTRGAPCSFKCKQGLQGRKRQGRQIDGEKDERCALQFQVQAGAPGKKTSGRQIDGEKDERGAMKFQVQAGAPGKTSGAPNWRKKGREMRHAVSSASRGSKKENVRGAKLTEKKDKRCPCSFKCKQGLHGRKRQARQIDGEKENKSLNCQTYFPFGLKIRNVVFLNSMIMMLASFTFLLYSTMPRQCRPWSYRGKKLVIPFWQMAKEVNTTSHHPHSLKSRQAYKVSRASGKKP